MDPSLIINIALGIAVFVLALGLIVTYLKLRKLSQFMTTFFEGKDAKNLEDVILNQDEGQKRLFNELESLRYDFNSVKDLARSGLRKIGIVRYNSFEDIGGEQSFSLAMLDNAFSGVVISSIHGRNVTRVYAKPIDNLTSRFPLSREENMALEEAKKSQK